MTCFLRFVLPSFKTVPNAGKRLLETAAKFLISAVERLLTRDGNDIVNQSHREDQDKEINTSS